MLGLAMTGNVSPGAANAMSSLKRDLNDIGGALALCADIEEVFASKKQRTRHEEEVSEKVGVIVQEDAEIEGQKEKQHDSTVFQLMESSFTHAVENSELKLEDNQELVDLNHSTSLFKKPPWKYDVFLSFRGKDTRRGIISHLYHELKFFREIETFKDDRDLEIGDPIGETLLKAIEESHFAIIVLSKNYAESAWCLEELTKICQCMKDNKRILPLFYHVKPTNVRFQKSSFGDAFTNHVNSGRYSSEKVQQWRKALGTVASFSGWEAKNYLTDRELVEAISEVVCEKVLTIENDCIISSRDFEPFKATTEAMENVMKALKDEKVVAIGVYGMGGIGKTTMVEHIAIEAKKEGLFNHVIMAKISHKPDLWQIQARLAFMLGVTLKDGIARTLTLRSQIMRKTRILIILDDIWTERELSKIGIPSIEELKSRNSKVLLTTRKKDVCSVMPCQAEIPLKTLSEEDSWKLFEKNTGKSFDQTTESYSIARMVAGECAGLPVALKAVAKALRGKNFNRYKEAARRLKESKLPNPEDEGHVVECIKLSYDYLTDDDSKVCFLLCCLFPEGNDIQIEDLLKYVIGKGLFPEDDIQEARATLHSVIESLKDSSLLLDGKEKRGCIRMHDVIRDIGVSISLSTDGQQRYFVKAGCELRPWPRIDARGCYNAISLMKNRIRMLPSNLVCSELQILLLQDNCYDEIPELFFESLKALKVLDLSQTSISLLPQSFNILISLHTLCLNCCLSVRSDISLLGSLRTLEILSMTELPLLELPEEIGQLTNLRMLDFTSECVGVIPSNVIRNLSELEELYMQCNFVEWRSIEESEAEGAREEKKASFDELTSLSRLHNLKVCISDPICLPSTIKDELMWKNFDIRIGRNSSIRNLSLDSGSSPESKALTLDTTMGTLPEWFIDVVTKNTEKLQYRNCGNLKNLLEEYYKGTLHALKYLHVIGPCDILVQLMTTITFVQHEPVFENLVELHLDEVNCLEELCVGELQSESLCKLKVVKVRGCHKLMYALLQSNLLERLQNLEILSCEDMDALEYVFASEGSELEQSTLEKLSEMRLVNLGNLLKIWGGPAPREIFSHVKVLIIFECNKLKCVFTSDVAHHLHELEDLSVEACRGMERVIEASEETAHNKIVLPKLKKLALETLLHLARFYGSNGSAIDDEENIDFPLLEHCHVKRCSKFNSPTKKILDSMMNKHHVLIPS